MSCGNKAKGLIELQRLGINVPNFIATDKEFFIEFMKLCQVYEEAQLVVVKSAWLKESFENIVKGISLAKVDAQVFKLLEDKIEGIKFPVSVRSSCSIEDSTKESCAGLFHTELGVEKERLVDAIKKVAASLYNNKCLLTLNKQSFHPEHYFMGIVIQEMLEPQWSGVAFSKDPVNGDDGIIIIEAVNGLGEELVSGQKISEHIVIDKYDKISENKFIKSELIDELKKILISLEKHYGYAVDVEWAIQNDKLYILQCRPITAIKEAKELDNHILFSMAELNEKNYELLAGLKARYKKWLKKARFYKFCDENNIITNKWKLFAFSKKNLQNVDYNELLEDYESPYIIYHLNNKFLSVCRKEKLKEVIDTYVSEYDDKQYCISVRESLPNVISAISQINNDKEIQIECVSGKMSVLNNGIVHPTMYISSFEGDIKHKAETTQELYGYDEELMDIVNTKVTATVALSEDIIKYIANMTKKFKNYFGPCSVEWWIWNNKAYAADMSLLSSSLDTKEGRIISEGKVSGILRSFPSMDKETESNLNMFSAISVSDTEFDINKVDAFAKLNQYVEQWRKEGPVVLYSKLPYIYLTPFVKCVDGFIFENASSLCHLSLIIREAKVPAISLLGSNLDDAMNKQITVNAYEGVIQK